MKESSKKRSIPVTRYYKSSVKPSNSVKNNNAHKKSGEIISILNEFIRKLPQRIFLLAIVALLIINTTVSSNVSVKIQDISNQNTYRPLSDYNDGINQLMNESVLYKSKFTLSSTTLESKIKELFPEVVDATVVVPLTGRKLQVGLRLGNPLIRLRLKTDKQGIVGENGKLLILTGTNTILESFSTLPSLVVEPNVDFEQGSQVLTSAETSLVSLLLAEFDGSEPYRYAISSITFQVEKREMQVNFEGKSFFAKLTPERGVRGQVGALLATLKNLQEQGALPGSYIDVRVEDRVFVK